MASRTSADTQPPIERASAADRAFLAMGSAKMPGQFGVILVLDPAPGFDLGVVRALVAERILAVPRFSQKLVRAPFGCGGPIWVDDPRFDLADHIKQLTCPAPHDRRAMLDMALSVIATPLRKDAPLWAATLLTGLQDGRVALVLVLHHAFADGVGGLAVLGHMMDGSRAPAQASFLRPAPVATALARDSILRKLRALRALRRSWRMLRDSAGASGGVHPQRARPCSLISRTGPHRRLEVISADLAAVRAAAHRQGATVNDAVLVAVAGALRQVLAARGELVDPLVVTVPVSGRDQAGQEALGNMVSPMLVPVPMTGTPAEGLEKVARHVLAHKAAATAPAPIALLGWAFRPLARLGGYRWYMNHQHRLHTLVSYVRGPEEHVSFGGSAVVSAIPAGVAEGGNLTVYFEVMSYAGTLTVTAITDPDHFPGTSLLADAMHAEFDLITANESAGSGPSALAAPDVALQSAGMEDADRRFAPATFVRLDRAESLRLLASVPVGRLILTIGALPTVRPMNFAVIDDRIVLRTAADSAITRRVDQAVVAFEADQLDGEAGTGWSVTVTGRATQVTDPEAISRYQAVPLAPWAPGDRELFVTISTELVEGRRIERAPG